MPSLICRVFISVLTAVLFIFPAPQAWAQDDEGESQRLGSLLEGESSNSELAQGEPTEQPVTQEDTLTGENLMGDTITEATIAEPITEPETVTETAAPLSPEGIVAGRSDESAVEETTPSPGPLAEPREASEPLTPLPTVASGSDKSWIKEWIPWALMGTGVLLTVYGIGMFYAADDTREDVRRARRAASGEPITRYTQRQAYEREEEAQRLEFAGTLGLILGTAAIGGGATMLYYRSRPSEPDEGLSLQPSFGVDFVQLGVGGRF